MNRRVEPRFQVYSAAKVIQLDDPQTELSGSIINISASDLRLLMDESLPPYGVIVVETEHHLILGEVQQSEARGTFGFAVGAYRLQTIEKLELPPDATMTENILSLIDDFHLRLRNELTNAPPSRSQTTDEPPEETLPWAEGESKGMSSPQERRAIRWSGNPRPDAAEDSEVILPPVAPLLPEVPSPTSRHFSAILAAGSTGR